MSSYIVMSGQDYSHMNDIDKVFSHKKKALKFYDNIESGAKIVMILENKIIIAANVEGKERFKHNIETSGQVFSAKNRTELMKQIKNHLEEYNDNLLDFTSFRYFNGFTGDTHSDNHSTFSVLNNMLRKENKATKEKEKEFLLG